MRGIFVAVVFFGVLGSSLGAKLAKSVSAGPDYDNPIRTAAQDEIINLPGLNEPINFRQYSGYLQANDLAQKPIDFLHYWFVESQGNPKEDPILLWLNGGPGCSSVSGLLTELGPFSVEKDGKSLSLREHSWNKLANVLFLESPTGVGYSYTTSMITVQTDDITAIQNYLALKSFFNKFPRYKNSSLYLSGESYAGVYLPTLGVLVGGDPEMSLKGVAIGNGYLDVDKLTWSLTLSAFHHGLYGEKTWALLAKDCCNANWPSREACNFGPNNKECVTVATNLYYHLLSLGLNPYNLYADCDTPASSFLLERSGLSRSQVDRQMLLSGLNYAATGDKQHLNATNYLIKPALSNSQVPCIDDSAIYVYMNQASVRRALHIPDSLKVVWDVCAILEYDQIYAHLPGGLAPQMKQLLASTRNLTMLVYNGDVDLVCNFLGDEWFVDGLGQPVIKDYENWHVDRQIAGWVKHYEGITFATVRGSGHMVPQDRPSAAFAMIQKFLGARCKNVHL